MALPAEIHPNIGGENAPIAYIDADDGIAQVNGKPVTLPYAWSTEVSGNWRSEFQLVDGPSRVTLFTMHSCM